MLKYLRKLYKIAGQKKSGIWIILTLHLATLS